MARHIYDSQGLGFQIKVLQTVLSCAPGEFQEILAEMGEVKMGCDGVWP